MSIEFSLTLHLFKSTNHFYLLQCNTLLTSIFFYLIGKTMVARALGKLLHMVGVLPSVKVTEVQRTDLVGEFVGHTGPKTRRKVSISFLKCYILPCKVLNYF